MRDPSPFGHLDPSFDTRFNSNLRTASRVGGAIGFLFFFAGLALLGALVYVAVHFLAKVW